LFFSGFCALVYQVAWLRELRLIFGASTAASAAVLAVFMAGLGFGGLWFGRKSEQWKNPLLAYANLELLIGVASAITPGLVLVARKAYFASGGGVVLGSTVATVLRLVLAVLILGVPTLLMGGTLPAAAKAVGRADDAGRGDVGVLYGVNTCGAVLGTFLANFVMLEVFGTRLSLWMACLLNVLVGVVARMASRQHETPVVVVVPKKGERRRAKKAKAKDEEAEKESDETKDEKKTDEAETKPDETKPDEKKDDAKEPPPKEPEAKPEEGGSVLPARLAGVPLVAAFVSGFVFFLLELAWYRMLGPLLGGSSYTFGLILTVALIGIGAGSAAYARWLGNRPATLRAFGYSCIAEALAVLVPFVLGDRIALFALTLRPLSTLGFWGSVGSWFAVTTVVVLPAAFISGLQFPLLIGLFGRGSKGIGRHVGTAYVANTAGAILGSLAGGFGFLPWLSATGCWRLVGVVLTATSVLAFALSLRFERKPRALAVGAL
jgi:MFS family permease